MDEEVSWLKIALRSPCWSEEELTRARALYEQIGRTGEVAELMGCSIFTLQAELGIGRSKDVRKYRQIRGLPHTE